MKVVAIASNLLLLICVNGLPVPTTAQVIERFYDYNWKPCKPARASYYSQLQQTDSGVLRQDIYIHTRSVQMVGLYTDTSCKVKQGYFSYYYANRNLEQTGRYVNGQKEGAWLRYHYNGMMQDSTYYVSGRRSGTSLGWYANGFMSDSVVYSEPLGFAANWYDNGYPDSYGGFQQKQDSLTGHWVFFHPNGQKSADENYDENGKLQQAIYYSASGAVLQDTTQVNREASFPGGSQAWMQYLQDNVSFPERYQLKNSHKVVVLISFIVNESGNIEDA
ncbi:MAG TPA: hypothetical protein PKK69_04175, partial [Ferruginibacter sp.]|nr:hypothetical protein [Ferruginibacter sp.]